MAAQVAGPGKFSQRTDKAVSNANNNPPADQYGGAQDYHDVKSGAPMAQDSGSAPAMDFSSLFGNAANRVVPINAPSQQPNTPVTAGANAGPGPGQEALGLQNVQAQDLSNLKAYLPVLEYMANQPGASWAMRNVVRAIKAQ